ncbi:MAG: PTS sugar transporter subunit IIA, partial [Phycisphaerae bacterium]
PYVSAEPLICLARVPQGVPFGSPDGVLTQLFFLICSHEDRQHLQVLARLVRMLDKETVDALRGTDAAEEALALLIRREEQVAERDR